MKNYQTLTLLFWHRKSKADVKGNAPVICRLSIEGEEEAEIATGKKVHSTEWCLDNKKAKGTSAQSKETNLKISEMTVDLNRLFTVLQTQHERITPLMVKNLYQGKPAEQPKEIKARPLPKSKDPVPTLLQAADKHIANFEKMVDKGLRSGETLKQWRATRKKIEKFIIYQYHSIDLPLDMVEFAFAKQFYDFLTIEMENVIGEAAAKKQVKNTKEILNFAETSKWVVNNPISKSRV